jgi:hypothetical protein
LGKQFWQCYRYRNPESFTLFSMRYRLPLLKTSNAMAFALLAWVAGALTLRAELRWDTKSIELKPAATESSVDATFRFINAGTSPVTIVLVEPTCECIVATTAKTTYGPGERGAVEAHYDFGDLRGVNRKSILVKTADASRPTTLDLTVTIREPARMTPTLLTWSAEEGGKPKMITIQALPNQPIQVLKVTSQSATIRADVETVEESKEYRITVTPASLEKAGFSALRIETTLMGKPKTLLAYVRINRGR